MIIQGKAGFFSIRNLLFSLWILLYSANINCIFINL